MWALMLSLRTGSCILHKYLLLSGRSAFNHVKSLHLTNPSLSAITVSVCLFCCCRCCCCLWPFHILHIAYLEVKIEKWYFLPPVNGNGGLRLKDTNRQKGKAFCIQYIIIYIYNDLFSTEKTNLIFGAYIMKYNIYDIKRLDFSFLALLPQWCQWLKCHKTVISMH